jgi:hypothetical protein
VASPRPFSGDTTSLGVAGGARVVGRDRNGRPIVGTAMARPAAGGGGGSFSSVISVPLFSPFGWSPWYYQNGFNWNLGYAGFDPFGYGGSRWFYGRYGLWYDPFMYYPYDPYTPYWYGPTSYSTGSIESTTRDRAPLKRVTGSVRLRVSPPSAKVYVDGTLMGTVDDFDGLTHHLDIQPGSHSVEFRADGYETHVTTIRVVAGQTVTERASLKKKK